MSSGIRATVSFTNPGDCPIAASSGAAGTTIEQVSTSAALPNTDGSVTEFLTTADVPDDIDARPVFSYGEKTLYRTRHDGEERCPCECLGKFGCPIHRHSAEGGTLTLVFHAEDFDTLQDVVGALREKYPPIDVERLLQPPFDGTPEEQVFVDRGTLTERQLEALQTAYEMGYFERPKGANATEVATEIGITQSTFTEHLMHAQRKLLGQVLDTA